MAYYRLEYVFPYRVPASWSRREHEGCRLVRHIYRDALAHLPELRRQLIQSLTHQQLLSFLPNKLVEKRVSGAISLIQGFVYLGRISVLIEEDVRPSLYEVSSLSL